KKLSRNKLYAKISTIAAILICAVALTIYTINSTTPVSTEIDYLTIAQNSKSVSKEVTINLDNSSSIEVQNNATIEHSKNGKTTINEKILEEQQSSDKSHISQIIVPKSKRAEVILSDGSKVTLNSDSRIIYKTNFGSDLREVYIEGEAFLDVAKDNGRPFIVKTKNFKVNVTGTRFNVTSYDNDNASRVVLVSGKVNVDVVGKPKMFIAPGQMFQLDKQNSTIENVDTYKYICWIDKLMIFENQPLGEVAARVSRFYNIDIEIEKSHSSMIINGKLDLKDDASDVVNTLSIISKLKATKLNNTITLTHDSLWQN
ncbi:MAG: FecR domain-containing protein, partial [Rikenellaceae bacterium]